MAARVASTPLPARNGPSWFHARKTLFILHTSLSVKKQTRKRAHARACVYTSHPLTFEMLRPSLNYDYPYPRWPIDWRATSSGLGTLYGPLSLLGEIASLYILYQSSAILTIRQTQPYRSCISGLHSILHVSAAHISYLQVGYWFTKRVKGKGLFLQTVRINMTFCALCIVIYLRNKDQQDVLFSLNLFQ